MKNNKKIFLVAISVVFFVLVVICGYYLNNKTAIKCNNKTAFYVQEFLDNTPTSTTVLSEINKTTQEFLDIEAFNKGFYFSKFHKQYITDVGLDNNANDRIKNQYFNEVIMLRLKVLVYQEDTETYNELFDTYIYDIENNLYTNVRLVSLFISDEKHPILYEGKLFELVEKSFVRAYDNCDNVTMKFYLLNEMIQFYSHFEECYSEEAFYREALAKLVNNNKALLQETLSEK